jgi:hypothetical protein
MEGLESEDGVVTDIIYFARRAVIKRSKRSVCYLG